MRPLAVLALALLAACCSNPAFVSPEAESQNEVLERTVAKLQRAVPPRSRAGVIFSWADLTPLGKLGLVTYDRRLHAFRVQLDDDLTGELLAAVIVHEWGHVLTWGAGTVGADPHGPIFAAGWGLAYNAVYRPKAPIAPGSPGEGRRLDTGTCGLSGPR